MASLLQLTFFSEAPSIARDMPCHCPLPILLSWYLLATHVDIHARQTVFSPKVGHQNPTQQDARDHSYWWPDDARCHLSWSIPKTSKCSVGRGSGRLRCPKNIWHSFSRSSLVFESQRCLHLVSRLRRTSTYHAAQLGAQFFSATC